ncbi:MAG: PAS domain S-box protein, partial [Nitrospinaceae bacterium]|nr:PAS domain S-box protein [Nitrospinaceae bacterium]NIR54854.1 PAS domain S-box protein [Nitrospinaceae bacterium]NIS85279.1 PAS domain S-box protein [Nitrospinaceae bacterium]NIT82092.1 PAS domain S-box protein [Nitrospinaceae bacterium]NIU44353.1 PAS domain S-box protein [Nitrospinaceae bacterium]
MVGKKRIHRIYPEDENTQMRVQAAVEKILKTKSATSLEIEEITKSRERIWFKLALAPRFDEIGQINGFLGIGENITERKNMEETLKRNEKRSRRIIDAAPMAFISTNAKGEI